MWFMYQYYMEQCCEKQKLKAAMSVFQLSQRMMMIVCSHHYTLPPVLTPYLPVLDPLQREVIGCLQE